MIGILLVFSIALFVGSMYGYLLPYHEAEQAAIAAQKQKAIATAVIVELVEGNDEWDDDRPTVVATPKMKQ